MSESGPTAASKPGVGGFSKNLLTKTQKILKNTCNLQHGNAENAEQ
jgi:hypothetical protein